MEDQCKVRVNQNIRAQVVRVVDENKQMLGVLELGVALRLAQSKGLDLIEVSPNAEPPVCKISDFGKFKYEAQKRLHDTKKKQRIVETKEIKVRPTIADGDYAIKLRNAKKFLDDGDKVRISLAFKGREITHTEVGFAIMKRFITDLEESVKVDLEPRMEGKQIIMIVSPI